MRVIALLILAITPGLFSSGSQAAVETAIPTWQVGPDVDTTWEEANAWVTSLGDGWRMPTIEELQALFEAGISFRDWGAFQNSGYRVWSAETRDAISAWFFDFDQGIEDWGEFQHRRSRCYYHGLRVFAIRLQ